MMPKQFVREVLAPLCAIGAILLAATGVAAQEGTGGAPAPVAPYEHDHDAPTAQAVRVPSGSISVDGKVDEAIWMTAPPISDFTQTVPNEGEKVTQKTEIRFVYD